MRVSLRWLNDYLELPTSDVEELKRAFDYLGHAVEDVVHHTAEWSDVFVGRVERIEAHPNADSVRVTHVDLGDGELQQIICGAWNFEAGAVVPVAIPGAVLPGGFEIGVRSIRGVESRGMICSERELGLGEVHEGIMVLEPNTPLGVPFESVLELPDVVFDLEVTSNRPDVMGMIGVARELAAWFELDVRMPPIDLETTPGDPALAVTIEAPDGCNRFVAREITDVAIGPSPLWLRERLRKAGVRAISNVVDVTNYVMFELGHPMHAFDADRIEGDRLNVRWAVEGERLVTLDDAERTLVSSDLVIEDDQGATSLAAVMGGARSEVNDQTTRVIMEAASWHPGTVMYTSRRHDLRSEASSRFERGVDPNLADVANARACRVLVEIAGGSVLSGVIDIVANETRPVTIDMTEHDVTRLLGDEFTIDRSAEYLRRVHLDVSITDGGVRVVVPTFRPDLTRPADLVEEIARLADFDTFGETVPTGPAGGLLIEQRRSRRIRDVLRGLGLYQAVNLPFVSTEELAAFGELEPHGGVRDVVTVNNPLRDDQAQLCQSLLPGLLRKLRENRNRGAEWVGLFETGRVFYARPWSDDPRVPEQPVRLAVAVTGPYGPRTLSETPPDADATTAFGIVASLSEALNVPVARQPAAPQGYHPTRTAALTVHGQTVGYAGELHPRVAEQYELGGRVAVLEVDLDPFVGQADAHQLMPVSSFPHVDFDLSFEVAPDASAAALVAATRAVSELVERVVVFDDYRDPEGELRAVALRYRLRADDRTLDAEEIAGERARMIEQAAALGATLRGAE